MKGTGLVDQLPFWEQGCLALRGCRRLPARAAVHFADPEARLTSRLPIATVLM
jgi:hypothetical protein